MHFGKTITRAALVSAILALGTGSAFAAAAYATGSVNVRTGPGTGYHRVDTLYRGENVSVTHCVGGWCHIVHAGPDGWVSARYLGQGATYWRGTQPNVTFSFSFGSPNAQFSFGNTPRPGPFPWPIVRPHVPYHTWWPHP